LSCCTLASFECLLVDWRLEREQAIRWITWVVGLIDEAAREGRPPD
jgi:hypothetical protein